MGAHKAVLLVGIGGREFSVGRLAGCRILFAESTLAALKLGLRMNLKMQTHGTVSYTHLRAHETRHDLVCRLLLEKNIEVALTRGVEDQTGFLVGLCDLLY